MRMRGDIHIQQNAFCIFECFFVWLENFRICFKSSPSSGDARIDQFLQGKIIDKLFNFLSFSSSVLSRRNPLTGFPVAFAKVVYKVSLDCFNFFLIFLDPVWMPVDCLCTVTTIHFFLNLWKIRDTIWKLSGRWGGRGKKKGWNKS